MSMHATEVGASQMAPEFVYDLLSRDDEETRRILDNVISIVIPCFNPDGQIMVTDWYHKYVGTPYEGGNPPWLYQKYVGHDNNRDAFQTNRSNRNTWRRSCSASGFRRPTSIITTWARTARASTCRRTRIRCGRTPIRWCGAR